MLTCNVGLLSGVGTWEGISIRHPHIPRPWNPIRACGKSVHFLTAKLSIFHLPPPNVLHPARGVVIEAYSRCISTKLKHHRFDHSCDAFSSKRRGNFFTNIGS